MEGWWIMRFNGDISLPSVKASMTDTWELENEIGEVIGIKRNPMYPKVLDSKVVKALVFNWQEEAIGVERLPSDSSFEAFSPFTSVSVFHFNPLVPNDLQVESDIESREDKYMYTWEITLDQHILSWHSTHEPLLCSSFFSEEKEQMKSLGALESLLSPRLTPLFNIH